MTTAMGTEGTATDMEDTAMDTAGMSLVMVVMAMDMEAAMAMGMEAMALGTGAAMEGAEILV